MRSFLFFCIIALFCSSCGRSVYNEYKEVKGEGWSFTDAKQFAFDIEQEGDYNLALNIRNTDNYPYSNIWVNLQTVGPSKRPATERFNLTMADVTGRWLGEGPGKLHDNRFLVKDRMHLVPGSYTFTLQHDMRPDVLEGIKEIGIRLKKID